MCIASALNCHRTTFINIYLKEFGMELDTYTWEKGNIGYHWADHLTCFL